MITMTATRSLLAGVAVAGAIAIAGCGSSGGGSSSGGGPYGGGGSSGGQGSAAQNGSTTGGPAVAIRNVGSVGQVLTDAKGRTLYVSDEESNGKVLCATQDCTAIWSPALVPGGQRPTGPDAVMGALGTLTRPDGKVQLALNGKPLYTFTFDHGAGDVNGNGQQDSFAGTDFTWHAATPSGAAPSQPASASNTKDPYGY